VKDTPEIIEKRIRAGYRPPEENPLACKNCGAAGWNNTPYRHRYFCKRHQFYVSACGYCPFFSTEKYVPPAKPAPKPPRFKQMEMF